MTALTDPRIPAQVRSLGANAVLLRKPFELSSELRCRQSEGSPNGSLSAQRRGCSVTNVRP